MKLKQIKDQVVVIFGASSGIGRATALKMASKGAKVAVVARSKTGIDSLVAEIKTGGGDALGIIADCTEAKQVRHVADSTIKRWGRIDTWVQVAGITVFASFEDTTEEEYVQIIDVNLLGCVRAARVALPLLKKQGGALIFVNSVEGQRGLQFQSAYASSKHAVKGLTDSLRIELNMEKAPVSVTNIYPSNIDTPLYDNCRVKVDNGEFKYTGVTPPTYSTDRTADSIIYAATHPVRDLVVGTGGWFLCQVNKIAPSMVDKILAKWGKCAERSKMKKANEDNMFKPLDKYNTTTGIWEKGTGPRVLPFSLYNAVRERPIFLKAAVVTLAMVGAALTAIATVPLNGEPLRVYEIVRNHK